MLLLVVMVMMMRVGTEGPWRFLSFDSGSVPGRVYRIGSSRVVDYSVFCVSLTLMLFVVMMFVSVFLSSMLHQLMRIFVVVVVVSSLRLR